MVIVMMTVMMVIMIRFTVNYFGPLYQLSLPLSVTLHYTGRMKAYTYSYSYSSVQKEYYMSEKQRDVQQHT